MTRIRNKRVVSLLAGGALAVLAGAAFAGVFGRSTLADFLGTDGRTHVNQIGDISSAPGNPCFDLSVFGKKVIVNQQKTIQGTITFKAWRGGGASSNIGRAVYSVQDPYAGGWIAVLDISEPDARISNPASGLYNSLVASYSHQNLEHGIFYKLTTYPDGSTTENASVIYGGFYQPPE